MTKAAPKDGKSRNSWRQHKRYCLWYSDLPINTVAGPSTSVSQAGWGGTASYVGPESCHAFSCILARHLCYRFNYQNEGLTIETNPLSSDPSNGIVIKQASATYFDDRPLMMANLTKE